MADTKKLKQERRTKMENKTNKLVVKFNQQQFQLLDNLKKEGKFGHNYADIIVNVFRKYIRQNFGKRGA